MGDLIAGNKIDNYDINTFYSKDSLYGSSDIDTLLGNKCILDFVDSEEKQNPH